MHVFDFSDLTLKFRTAAMFVSAVVYVMYSLFLPYLRTKFHMPDGSLAVVMKPKAEGQLWY